ncbi:16S rRNA (guanine(966)-N(2))-methyltransferase RsmD [Marinagarivorans algicola]|uniref:16S rRNA (guanine(966)-N(2))-methyltransferase RsmD n=1 Tax=Marinagarivorans algicola TaxID=1513270 RepID=UPI000AE75D1C|nr:16S rRNA (guanine(966)-N(2))-methyltransferase RsmD [Marinagarivorans algicola]
MINRRQAKKSKVATANPVKMGAANVKIIAGQWRGRVLRFPEVDGLRPTGNRIRETLFNWLAPSLPGSRCLDAFSGSGALGFEALSRGAASLTMLEPDRIANQHLHNNMKLLGASDCKIWAVRAEQWLAIPATESFDIVFIDPPFTLDLWPGVLTQLEQNGWLATNAYIYIETPKHYALHTPAHWQLQRSKQAGQVTFSLYQRGSD